MLGQLHLQFALVGPGAPGENIQNQGGAVNNLYRQGCFQVALLHRGKLIVEDYHAIVDAVFLRQQFFQFTFAEIMCFGRHRQPLNKLTDNPGSGRTGQQRQFLN